tara:strand:+ start:59500 stop:59748 length:249 start_codon:yes stop_codon:yes gene_type:complete
MENPMTVKVNFFKINQYEQIGLEWSLGTVSELCEGVSFSFNEEAQTAEATFPTRTEVERWTNIHIGEFPRLPAYAINDEVES